MQILNRNPPPLEVLDRTLGRYMLLYVSLSEGLVFEGEVFDVLEFCDGIVWFESFLRCQCIVILVTVPNYDRAASIFH